MFFYYCDLYKTCLLQSLNNTETTWLSAGKAGRPSWQLELTDSIPSLLFLFSESDIKLFPCARAAGRGRIITMLKHGVHVECDNQPVKLSFSIREEKQAFFIIQSGTNSYNSEYSKYWGITE